MKKYFTILATIASGVCAQPSFEVIGTFSQRPGNPAVGPDGTVYLSMHPFDAPEYKVMRLEDGMGIPFPTAEISQSFAAVIGIQADAQGRVWILDMGSEGKSPQLFAWDTQTDSIHKIIYLPKEATVANSFIQDFALDEKRGFAYLADMSRGGMIDRSDPAIIVVNLTTGSAHRVLQGHASLQAEAGKTMITEGTPATFTDGDGVQHPLQLGLNPIAIDPENEWVYFSTIHPGTLYRIPAATLSAPNASDQTLSQSIEAYSKKPTSDGIAVGGNGKVYITNLEDNALSIADADGLKTWIQHESFVWPDGVYVSTDGSVVATINQLNRAAPFNGGINGSQPPYRIVRISD